MNIGFYDPISERWIKPRPPKELEAKPHVSLGEALLIATEAAALREHNDRIWKITRQVAEGCNQAPAAEASAEIAPIVTDPNPPEYEVVESLGYIYRKPKN